MHLLMLVNPVERRLEISSAQLPKNTITLGTTMSLPVIYYMIQKMKKLSGKGWYVWSRMWITLVE